MLRTAVQGRNFGLKVGNQNILLSACVDQVRMQESTERCFYFPSVPSFSLPFPPLPFFVLPLPYPFPSFR